MCKFPLAGAGAGAATPCDCSLSLRAYPAHVRALHADELFDEACGWPFSTSSTHPTYDGAADALAEIERITGVEMKLVKKIEADEKRADVWYYKCPHQGRLHLLAGAAVRAATAPEPLKSGLGAQHTADQRRKSGRGRGWSSALVGNCDASARITHNRETDEFTLDVFSVHAATCYGDDGTVQPAVLSRDTSLGERVRGYLALKLDVAAAWREYSAAHGNDITPKVSLPARAAAQRAYRAQRVFAHI